MGVRRNECVCSVGMGGHANDRTHRLRRCRWSSTSIGILRGQPYVVAQYVYPEEDSDVERVAYPLRRVSCLSLPLPRTSPLALPPPSTHLCTDALLLAFAPVLALAAMPEEEAEGVPVNDVRETA